MQRKYSRTELGMSYGVVAGMLVGTLVMGVTGSAVWLGIGLSLGLVVGLVCGQLADERSHPGPPPATTGRGWGPWPWPVAALAITALVGAVALGALTYRGLQDRLTALPRTGIPGEVTFEVPGPEGVTVFYEDPDTDSSFVVWSDQTTTISSSPVDLGVVGPSGPHVLERYERDLRFGVDGRVAAALATFDAPQAGTYTLEVSGDVPPGARVSVGDVVDARLLGGLAGAIALLLLGIFGVAVAVVVTLVGRVDQQQRPMGHPVN